MIGQDPNLKFSSKSELEDQSIDRQGTMMQPSGETMNAGRSHRLVSQPSMARTPKVVKVTDLYEFQIEGEAESGDGAAEGARHGVVGGGSSPRLQAAGHELFAVRGEHAGFAALGIVHGLQAAAQAPFGRSFGQLSGPKCGTWCPGW